jgi:DNA-binding response OmpR family regulator
MAQKILLIEDDEQIRRMYQQAFVAGGFECEEAGDGNKGIEMAKQNKPDLILLDMMMPDIDGLTILDKLKHDETVLAIPVIVLSNLSAQEGIDNAMRLGAMDYINKSAVKPRDVVEKVKILLTSR